MRLINTRTGELEEFMDDRRVAGEYAILSHTWGNQEVSYEEFFQGRSKQKEGYRKIQCAVKQALKDGIEYLWCDTCCIDKRSSAELSEAINSMYRWYYNAKVCYAYLSDLRAMEPDSFLAGAPYLSELETCRWFSRGWTLQELIAPNEVVFYDANWTAIFTKSKMPATLSEITNIDKDILVDRSRLQETSVAKRMSFASSRKTTRLEDQAYSLLGIFDVNMPLLYGEGSRAFKRLQEEIIRSWSRVDHSILAWQGRSDGLFANDVSLFPVDFGEAEDMAVAGTKLAKRDIISWSLPQGEVFEISNKGLRISVLAASVNQQHVEPDTIPAIEHLDNAKNRRRLLVALNCSYSSAKNDRLGMFLRRRPWVGPGRPLKTTTALSVSAPDGQTALNDNENLREDYAIYEYESLHVTIKASILYRFTMMTCTIARTPYYHWPTDTKVRVDWIATRFTDIKPIWGLLEHDRRTLKLTKSRHHRFQYGLFSLVDSILGDNHQIYLHLRNYRSTGQEPELGVALSCLKRPSDLRIETIESNRGIPLKIDDVKLWFAMATYDIVDAEMKWRLTVCDLDQATNSTADFDRLCEIIRDSSAHNAD